MRVLHYLELEDRLQRSGIGTAVSNQRRALARTDIEVLRRPTALVRGEGSVTGDTLSRLQGGGIDLVHCNGIGPGTFALSAWARRTGTPLLLHAHVTSEDFADSFRGSTRLAGPLRKYLRRLYSRADLVACPSEYTRRNLRDYPVDVPVYPITNGVDIDSLAGFESHRSSARERFDLSGTVVFTVGNVFERKGLSAFCRLARRTEYEFVWFGPYERGPLASREVRRWTRNPPENVTFTGWVDDVRDAYAAGDIFCFPTSDENQGIAVLEAMACRKPVVLRRLPVFEELYTHGEDCLLCETEREFQEALERLASDPALRERLGANAAQTASRHGLDRLVTELPRVYEAVASGRPEQLVDERDGDV